MSLPLRAWLMGLTALMLIWEMFQQLIWLLLIQPLYGRLSEYQ
ncbi:hypothetical protein HMPREF0758_1574 [Serratia odorifera DSM 4582]|uniref:Uncharacterized protein n=1 Tax=Serratia odorifera DSM 4582 TaxID=667129 RepID=D4E074_SEROD|nr:hypothetical protein HMPREF0758_1574 [Serratia odorifera DSM 4582]